MSASDHLEVDLFDAQDIRTKLPEARRIYRAKREELEQLSEEVRRLGELVELLARVAGETPAVPEAGRIGGTLGGRIAPGQERAVAALERAGRPMGPSALFKFMQKEHLEVPANANALGANLWAAAKAGRIKKVTGLSGLYAPLSWEPEPPLNEDGPAPADYLLAVDSPDLGAEQTRPPGEGPIEEGQEPAI